MNKPCRNLKCDYFGMTRCFARRCVESCRNPKCAMRGQDHFAQMCREVCEHPNCRQMGQYHPPGECYINESSAIPMTNDESKMATAFFAQTLSNMAQIQQSGVVRMNSFGPGSSPHNDAQMPHPQAQQAFNPLAGLPFSPAPGNAGVPNWSFGGSGGWPFQQN